MISDVVVHAARSILEDDGYPAEWLARLEIDAIYSRLRDEPIPADSKEPWARPFQDDVLIVAERKQLWWSRPILRTA